ncbi:MAG: GNAT family N-acetyltransferase [Pseudomonadota bacterium]
MQHLEISKIRPDDLPPLGSIIRDTDLFPPEMLADLVAEGQAEGHVCLTARLQGDILGFVLAQPEPLTDGTWNMRALAVAPSSQARGVGKALVAAAEKTLSEAQHRLLLVDTSGTSDFSKTRAFYRAVGYHKVAEIEDFWREGDAKITFAKVLNGSDQVRL